MRRNMDHSAWPLIGQDLDNGLVTISQDRCLGNELFYMQMKICSFSCQVPFTGVYFYWCVFLLVCIFTGVY